MISIYTKKLNPDNYLGSVHNIIEELAPGWQQDKRIQLMVVDIDTRRTFIVIDINNRGYDFQTAHENTLLLPVHIARPQKRSTEWIVTRGQAYDTTVANHIKDMHQSHGWDEHPPFVVDRQIQPVVFMNHRNLKPPAGSNNA